MRVRARAERAIYPPIWPWVAAVLCLRKTVESMNRRVFVSSLVPCAWALQEVLTVRGAIAESSLTVRDLSVGGDAAFADRARLLIPAESSERRRVLVLLYGRGEAGNMALGLRAWPELYGLQETDRRLRAGRVTPPAVDGQQVYTHKEQFAALRQELRQRPYRGMAFVCPVTPNPSVHGSREKALSRYAAWLEEQLLPAVRREIPEAQTFGIDGCSMGGWMALEMFLRKPHLFSTLGLVQAAFGAFRAPGFAERLAATFSRVGQTPIHIETSSQDAFREGNEALARELSRRGVEVTLDIPRGPHNQPFLRQIGTLLMLRWHSARLPV